MEQILGDPSTKAAIMHLQAAMRAKFPGKSEGIGDQCLFVEADSVIVTNEEGRIIARGPAKVAQALGRGRGRKAEGRGQRTEKQK